MIERCSYCGKVHETGDGLVVGGIPFKECPEVPPDQIVGLPPRRIPTVENSVWSKLLGEAGNLGFSAEPSLVGNEWPEIIE